MKKLIHPFLLAVLFFVVCGCATTDKPYQTRIKPPDTFNTVFMRYKELPGEKVLVIAVDPGGHWSFGYDYGRGTLEEAAKTATLKCDKARNDHLVHTKAKLFAVNDKVVYYDKIFKK